MTLNYAKNKTLNITFGMITSIINQTENAFHLDPSVALDDLAMRVAQACFCNETIIFFDIIIVDNHNQSQNMTFFLRRCVMELERFSVFFL
jgi:hypothetical protein